MAHRGRGRSSRGEEFNAHLHIRGAVKSEGGRWAVSSLVEDLLGASMHLRVTKIALADEVLKIRLECLEAREPKKAFDDQAWLLCQAIMDTEKQNWIYKYSSFGLLGFEPQPKTFESYWLKALCKAIRERGVNFTDEIKVVSGDHIPSWALGMNTSMITGLPIRHVGLENIPFGYDPTRRVRSGRRFLEELIDEQQVPTASENDLIESIARWEKLVGAMVEETRQLRGEVCHSAYAVAITWLTAIGKVTRDGAILEVWLSSMRHQQYEVLVALGRILVGHEGVLNEFCDKFNASGSGSLLGHLQDGIGWLTRNTCKAMARRLYQKIRVTMHLYLIRRDMRILEEWRASPKSDGTLSVNDMMELGTNGVVLRWKTFINASLRAGSSGATADMLSEIARSSKGMKATPNDVVVYMKRPLAFRMEAVTRDLDLTENTQEEGLGRRYRVRSSDDEIAFRNFTEMESDDEIESSSGSEDD